MRTSRSPEKEGKQDTEAVRAYNRTCTWLPFRLLRYFILRDLAKYHPHGKLIDVGCGTGHLVISIKKKFPGLDVRGLDINRDMIDTARHNSEKVFPGGNYFDLGDVHSLPYEDGFFDIIVSSLSLHHWDDAAKALSEIRRVLAPGGKLLLVDIRRDCPWWFFYGFVLFQTLIAPADIKRTNGAIGSIYAGYTPGELAALLNSASFKDVITKSNPGWMTAFAQKG